MDLSHLVSIGLFPAKRAPLRGAELEYFQKHRLEQSLADIVDQLAKQKPADPYRFIAEAASKLSGAPTPTAAPVTAKTLPAPVPPATGGGGDVDAKVKAVSDELRALKERLKGEGIAGKQVNEHEEVKRLVAQLQELKAKLAAPAAAEAPAPKAAAPKASPAPKAAPAKGAAPKEDQKPKQEKGKKKAEKETAVAVGPSKGGGVAVKKADDVPAWYEQVIMKAELIEQYPVKGCFILRPWSYRIWEVIQGWFDKEIKLLGVENCYFPMFIPKCYIEKEEDHLNDFAPELAWVSKFGNQDIDEPVAIRPTSETAMYAAYSNWVQSHRDLPIKLNQWCSVVRWEVKQTTPFLRTREFLWQEGHTAHANREAAAKEVLDILELYALIYEHLMAIPVVRGTKTKAETFPGADYTTTVEAFIPATGRAIQGATSHHLGQNFSKMFDISFQDPTDASGKARDYAYQNSWGVTQRTIGVMVMVHGDDKGLVLPPRVAAHQVVIVPVGMKASSSEEDRQALSAVVARYEHALRQAGLRVHLDDRDNTPGWKFNYWEMKGVPLRIEVGPMDIKKGEFVMAKRNLIDSKDGKLTGRDATLVEDVTKTLDTIQEEMYAGAVAKRDAKVVPVDKWEDFSPTLNQGKLLLVPFCGDPKCEEAIKEKTKEEAADVEVVGGLKMGAKSLCVPHEEKYNVNCPSKCIRPECESTVQVTQRTLFGRSY